jgi:hypothetical protein
MPVNYNTTLKNTRMTAVVTSIGSAGKIEIGTTLMAVVLATINLSNPCGTVSGGVLTFSGTPLTVSSAANSGTAANARVRDGSNTDIITGLTVSSTSGDIVLSSTNIVAGQPVTLTSASITHG